MDVASRPVTADPAIRSTMSLNGADGSSCWGSPGIKGFGPILLLLGCFDAKTAIRLNGVLPAFMKAWGTPAGTFATYRPCTTKVSLNSREVPLRICSQNCSNAQNDNAPQRQRTLIEPSTSWMPFSRSPN